MNSSLNSRFSVFFIVLTITIVVSLSSILVFQFRDSMHTLAENNSSIFSEKLQDSLFHHAESIVTILAEDLVNPIYQLDIQTIYEQLVPVLKNQNVISVVVYDMHGEIIHDGDEEMTQYGKMLSDQKTLAGISLRDHFIKQLENNDSVISVSRSIWLGDEPLGGVKVQMSLSDIMQNVTEMQQQQQQLEKKDTLKMLGSVLITALIFVTISIVLSIVLARFLTKPIQALAAQAIAIGQGKFTEVAKAESSDEISTLINSFSKMSADLEANVLAREEAETQLIERERLSALGQMAGTIAHDFNNLLTVIIGNLKLLIDTPEDAINEDNKKMIDSALIAAENGARLTRGILTVSRKQVLHPESLDANRLLHNFVSLASHTIGKRIQFELSMDTNAYFIYVDKNQMQNALFNLAINSKDAMPNGGTITLDVKRTTLGDETLQDESLNKEILNEDNDSSTHEFVIISFTDTGTGIPSDVLNKVREPFFTTKGVGKGTGLGLSAVNEFVIQSNGKMDITSAPGQGTSISIFLPLSHYKKSDDTENRSVELETGTETILVTDDEPLVRMVGVTMLKRLGYNTLEAENADEAIEIVESGADIALIFSDVNMPGSMDGNGLLKWVKKHRPDIKFLLTSGFYEIADADSSVEMYLTPVLTKPYSISKLASKIREELDSPNSD